MRTRNNTRSNATIMNQSTSCCGPKPQVKSTVQNSCCSVEQSVETSCCETENETTHAFHAVSCCG